MLSSTISCTVKSKNPVFNLRIRDDIFNYFMYCKNPVFNIRIRYEIFNYFMYCKVCITFLRICFESLVWFIKPYCKYNDCLTVLISELKDGFDGIC